VGTGCRGRERAGGGDAPPWLEQAAAPHIRASLLFIVASDDEMMNCNIEVQREAYRHFGTSLPHGVARRQPRQYHEIPTPPGGHVGLMDSCNFMGFGSAWGQMMDKTVAYLKLTFDLR